MKKMKRWIAAALAVCMSLAVSVPAFAEMPAPPKEGVERANAIAERVKEQYGEDFDITFTKDTFTQEQLDELENFLICTAQQQKKAREQAEYIKRMGRTQTAPYALDYEVYSGTKTIEDTLPDDNWTTIFFKQSLSMKVSPQGNILSVYNIKTSAVSSSGKRASFTSSGDAYGYVYEYEYANVTDKGHYKLVTSAFTYEKSNFYVSSQWHLSDVR